MTLTDQEVKQEIVTEVTDIWTAIMELRKVVLNIREDMSSMLDLISKQSEQIGRLQDLTKQEKDLLLERIEALEAQL